MAVHVLIRQVRTLYVSNASHALAVETVRLPEQAWSRKMCAQFITANT